MISEKLMIVIKFIDLDPNRNSFVMAEVHWMVKKYKVFPNNKMFAALSRYNRKDGPNYTEHNFKDKGRY